VLLLDSDATDASGMGRRPLAMAAKHACTAPWPLHGDRWRLAAAEPRQHRGGLSCDHCFLEAWRGMSGRTVMLRGNIYES
jgi:hypothetical protein